MRGHLARLWPKTMAARITLIMVIALFVAQILNVALLMGERQLEALSTRTTLAERACTPAAMDIARMAEPPRQADLRRLATPAMTFFLTRDGLPPGAKLTPDPQLAERIAGAFTREKTAFLAIEAGTRHQRPNTRAPQGMRPMDETFVAFKFAPAGSWYVCHVIRCARKIRHLAADCWNIGSFCHRVGRDTRCNTSRCQTTDHLGLSRDTPWQGR